MFKVKMDEVLCQEEIELINKKKIREFINLTVEKIVIDITNSSNINNFTRKEIEIIFKLVDADLKEQGYYSINE